MRIVVFFIFFILFACKNEQSKTQSKSHKTILAILAHPDDESAIGAVLSKFAKTDSVYLILAADGRFGVTDHAKIPPGDSLVKIREAESICACEILGIHPPIFLKFHDGLGLASGLGDYFDQTVQLKEQLKGQISKINPDIILTFGPDGDTGHPDHRGISDLTTEVILSEGWHEKHQIFYIGWLKDKQVNMPGGQKDALNFLDAKYLSVKIKYSNEDKEKLYKSLRCYKSQFSEKEMEDWILAEKSDTINIAYFRPLRIDTTVKTAF